MAIKSTTEYVDFFINLNMGENVSLLSFVNNERMVLKGKLEYKNLEKEPINKGIEILGNNNGQEFRNYQNGNHKSA
jgi:hypothetical protein